MMPLVWTPAYAQAPAGPNRPFTVPENYVITPFGYFHPSCVVQLKEGEDLLAVGPSIQRPDGSLERIGPCGYPRYSVTGELITGAEPPAIGHSWIESASVTTTTGYGELAAGWVVPPAPTSNDRQTIYFFPGMEDIDDVVSIIQPVLGWNADFGSAWGIASWNCCPSGITVESSPVTVSSGDKISGVMRQTCAAGTESCSTWRVTTTDTTTTHSTTLNNTPSEGQTFNWAFAGALEVYSVSRCSDYPSNGALTFGDIQLYDYNLNRISAPAWSLTVWASGLTPQCNYNAQLAPTQVKLDY